MLHGLQRQLELLDEEMELIAHIISHALRDPLRENLNSYDNISSEDNLDYSLFQKIKDNDTAVLDKATCLLDYIRVSKVGSKLKPLDCNEILEDVITMLAEKVTKTGADIKYSNLPNIMGRKKFITDLFLYVLDNAINFSKQGEIPKISISAKQSGDRLCEFTISDQGIGLEEEYEDLSFILFQKFNSDGEGVGLSMAKKIVESHGGEISLDGGEGIGAKLVFTLPMVYDK
jgi:light-regulated signal transduction histidine kinase (bacteriophytochrome)